MTVLASLSEVFIECSRIHSHDSYVAYLRNLSCLRYTLPQDHVDTMKLCCTAERDSSKFAHRLERNSMWTPLARSNQNIRGGG